MSRFEEIKLASEKLLGLCKGLVESIKGIGRHIDYRQFIPSLTASRKKRGKMCNKTTRGGGMKFDITQLGDICDPAMGYYDGCATTREAWDRCPRGDWMLYAAAKLGVDDRLMCRAQGLCAKTVEHLMTDRRSRDAVQGVLDYADGKITRGELGRIAADAAAARAAADCAACAADADAACAARTKNRKQTADICREVLTDAVFEKINIRHKEGE